MPRNVTVVFSSHGECGLCCAEELLKILRAIEPSVIFEELRPADSAAHYAANKLLEIRATTQYRQFRPCQQVPVDRFELRPEQLLRLKDEFDQLLDYVGDASEEYQRLDAEHFDNRATHGFGYLNSGSFALREARMLFIENEQVRLLGNPAIARVLEQWRQFNRAREIAMVASIYEYCRENVFERAVFLVGAAHRAGIVAQVRDLAKVDARLVNWCFYGRGDESDSK